MSTEMRPVPLTLIVAATRSNAIGRDSGLPWRLSKEMAYFARITKGEQQFQSSSTSSSSTSTSSGSGPGSGPGMNTVIMGRKSWEGIPSKFRPLPGRQNVVITRQQGYDLGDAPSTLVAHSLESAIDLVRQPSSSSHTTETGSTSTPATTTTGRIFLIGGAQLYNETLESLSLSSSSPSSATTTSTTTTTNGTDRSYTVDRVLLTRVLTDYSNCDTFLHPFTEDTVKPESQQEESLAPSSSSSSEPELHSRPETKVWRRASHEELVEWAGWEVPRGVQQEKDRAFLRQKEKEEKELDAARGGGVGEEEKLVEYEFQMWVRNLNP